MINKESEAIEFFRGNFNCAQSVLSVFAKDLGMDIDLAMKLASPFGAGIAYQQETCGAVTGSLMAIGLKYGKGINGTIEDKEKAYDMSQHFITEFTKIHGTTRCRELLDGIDMRTTEGMETLIDKEYFRLKCANYVRDAVRITERILMNK